VEQDWIRGAGTSKKGKEGEGIRQGKDGRGRAMLRASWERGPGRGEERRIKLSGNTGRGLRGASSWTPLRKEGREGSRCQKRGRHQGKGGREVLTKGGEGLK